MSPYTLSFPACFHSGPRNGAGVQGLEFWWWSMYLQHDSVCTAEVPHIGLFRWFELFHLALWLPQIIHIFWERNTAKVNSNQLGHLYFRFKINFLYFSGFEKKSYWNCHLMRRKIRNYVFLHQAQYQMKWKCESFLSVNPLELSSWELRSADSYRLSPFSIPC